MCSLCVQAVLSKADTDKSSDISFAEFVEYMREHERKLRLAFSDLDHNKDGNSVLLSFFANMNILVTSLLYDATSTLCYCN